MTPECLVKLENVVSSTVYDQLEEALKAGDNKAWTTIMLDAHADMSYIRRGAIKDALVRSDIADYLTKQKAKGIKPETALSDIISGGGVHQRTGMVPLDKYIEGIRGDTMASLVELIDATRPTMLGMRRASNPEFIENIVRGIYRDEGVLIPKGGKSIIEAWNKTTKKLLDRFNKAGGQIAELANFNIPVNHYAPHLKRMGEDAWVLEAKARFNIRQMAGKLKIDDTAKEGSKTSITTDALLRKMYKNIVSEGAIPFDADDIGKIRMKKLSNSHQHFRYLEPKSGKDWLEYNAKYGRHSNPIDSMKEYIDGMSSDIALMERFGTNPIKMIDDIVMDIQSKTDNKRAGKMALASFDQLYARNPYADDWLSNTARNMKALQTAVKLPLAAITALSDASFTAVRSVYNGMKPFKVFTRHMKNLVNARDYKTATRLGLLADYAINRATAASRFTDNMGFSSLDRVADFSVRASGLNHWTNAGKAAFGVEFLANLADHSSKSFDALPKGMRRAFERYGFGAKDWADISKGIYTKDGVRFVDPTSDALEDTTKANLIGMIREETNFAIPEPNAKTRAISSFGTRTNTVANEFIKVGTQFKTFGVSVLVSNMGVALDKGLPAGTRLAYMTSLVASTSAMGVLVLQLKDIAKGRTPREFSTKLALEGFIQGGAIGPYGDIFLNDPRLFGGVPAFVAGPTIGDLNRILTVGHGTIEEAMKEGGNWRKKLYPAMEKAGEELLFPTRLIQTRIAAERLFYDQARRLTNPDYYSKLRRQRKWMRTRGQEFWSKPK